MTKDALLKKIEAALDEAVRQRLYGNIEIEFRAGEPTFLRTHRQEKLDNETENRRDQKTYR
jgi:hypothetical protein